MESGNVKQVVACERCGKLTPIVDVSAVPSDGEGREGSVADPVAAVVRRRRATRPARKRERAPVIVVDFEAHREVNRSLMQALGLRAFVSANDAVRAASAEGDDGGMLPGMLDWCRRMGVQP